MKITPMAVADDEWALCDSPIILFSGLRQVRQPIAELLDTDPSPKLEMEIRRIAKQVAGVAGLEKCLARKMGFRYYVDLHVVVAGVASRCMKGTPLLSTSSRRFSTNCERSRRFSSTSNLINSAEVEENPRNNRMRAI